MMKKSNIWREWPPGAVQPVFKARSGNRILSGTTKKELREKLKRVGEL